MAVEESKVMEYLKRCSSDNPNACEKCPYLKWSKEIYGENKCKDYLMQDAYAIVYPCHIKNRTNKKLSKLDSVDVIDFFSDLVKKKKYELYSYGVTPSNISCWSKKQAMPKLPKFVSILRALGYDIKIVEVKNEDEQK